MSPSNTGVRTYSISDMLIMRPAMSAYVGPNGQTDKVREYLQTFHKYIVKFKSLSFNREIGLLDLAISKDEKFQICHRFVSTIPNKEFKRRWLRSGNTLSSLKTLTRYPVKVYDSPSKIIGRHLKEINFLESRLSHLRRMLRVQPSTFPSEKEILAVSGTLYRKPELVHRASSARINPAGRGLPLNTYLDVKTLKEDSELYVSSHRKMAKDHVLMQTIAGSYGTYSRPLGGLEKVDLGPFTLPPPKGGGYWKKYWYFYRTRGVWKPSEHHPYGDEIPVITDWLGEA